MQHVDSHKIAGIYLERLAECFGNDQSLLFQFQGSAIAPDDAIEISVFDHTMQRESTRSVTGNHLYRNRAEGFG